MSIQSMLFITCTNVASAERSQSCSPVLQFILFEQSSYVHDKVNVFLTFHVGSKPTGPTPPFLSFASDFLMEVLICRDMRVQFGTLLTDIGLIGFPKNYQVDVLPAVNALVDLSIIHYFCYSIAHLKVRGVYYLQPRMLIWDVQWSIFLHDQVAVGIDILTFSSSCNGCFIIQPFYIKLMLSGDFIDQI